MKTKIRKAGIACGTAFASIALALSTATGAGASSTAVMIGGIKIPTMTDMMMAPLLEGAFKNQTRTSVTWPAQAGPYSGKGDMTLGASIAVGIPNLEAAINTALGNLSRDAQGNPINGEKVTVVGLSAGSLVVNEVLRDWVKTGEMPDPEDVTFIVVEDSSRQKLINDVKYSSKFDYTYQPPPITPYDIIVITGEYDGMADMPDRPFNFLAIMNAMAGSIVVHVPVMYTTSMAELAALEGTKYYTEDTNIKGGVTKHYLVPTTTLPLVQLMPWLKPKEAELKAKIDKGYSRNDPVTATATATKTAALVPADNVATEAAATPASNAGGEEASSGQAQPAPKVDALSRRDARAEARAEAKAQRAEAKAARAEARAAAKADAAAKREARKAAREEAKSGGDTAPSDGSGSSDSSGSSE
ncbi:putative PPE family protein PPE42 [Mycolicibacterium chlorophenolicum]|uniref:Putative PPE family protein PPE42 n=2 Tax=Mycolicibacterium chlorophenolicum TaxID=37916 RepID=A0A0J6WKH0_9MYCO|nr:putative PPE family protein PPE42 [Mycolicibacterium chlorophenolicum]